jgi:hypothetical protein
MSDWAIDALAERVSARREVNYAASGLCSFLLTHLHSELRRLEQ